MDPRYEDFWKRKWFWLMVAAGAIASISVRLFWARILHEPSAAAAGDFTLFTVILIVMGSRNTQNSASRRRRITALLVSAASFTAVMSLVRWAFL